MSTAASRPAVHGLRARSSRCWQLVRCLSRPVTSRGHPLATSRRSGIRAGLAVPPDTLSPVIDPMCTAGLTPSDVPPATSPPRCSDVWPRPAMPANSRLAAVQRGVGAPATHQLTCQYKELTASRAWALYVHRRGAGRRRRGPGRLQPDRPRRHAPLPPSTPTGHPARDRTTDVRAFADSAATTVPGPASASPRPTATSSRPGPPPAGTAAGTPPRRSGVRASEPATASTSPSATAACAA